ncbi:MAG TPA: malto-oligosyltrehalose synthase [Planctomicrobium sp.]|nr:malto-oligosyltrehalose synthase [Planctomicrobium sp.]
MTDGDTVEDLATQLAETVWSAVTERGCHPLATYRLEFNKDHLSFRDAAKLVPYLASLGISHVYASPYLKSASGTSNNYAIVDYSELNPDLGTQEDYQAFVAVLKSHGMGQILDIVPNHMSTAVGENAWWTDVLEHGQSSPFATCFDIDWNPVEQALQNRILLPVLGDNFGDVLEQGELKLVHCQGKFQLHYYDHHFPLDPTSYSILLDETLTRIQESFSPANDILEMESLLTALKHLPERTVTDPELKQERLRETKVIQNRLRALIETSSPVQAALSETLRKLNGEPGQPASFDRLEQMLDRQVYRLSRWKAASDEINYRRFFDVNELAAICTERKEVFEASHAFLFKLLTQQAIHGLRIDHVDGLYDPRQYLWRLQWGYLEALARDQLEQQYPEADWNELREDVLDRLHQLLGGLPPGIVFNNQRDYDSIADHPYEIPLKAPLPLYVLVEKILGPDELLPNDWPVAGTTGYDFLNQLEGLFVKPEGFTKIQRNYRRFSSCFSGFSEIVQDSKRLILDVAMSSELQLLAHRLKRLARRWRHSRDLTLNHLFAALREIIICFPVYRTYIGSDGISARDRDVIDQAIRQARRRNPTMDTDLFQFIRRILLSEIAESEEDAEYTELFIGRFQQVTSPVMAKGVEDTVFYRYLPLISVNEVGGHPQMAPISVERFHEDNRSRLQQFPAAMLCSSTHDTKRSEDVRARIGLLSEIPDQWRTAVGRWSRMNRLFRTDLQGERSPTPNDEYLLYQTLVGIWPVEPVSEEHHQELVQRIHQYMEKATREEKLRTSWLSPDPDYEAAVRRFIEGALRRDEKNRFLNDLQAFLQRMAPASFLKSASEVLLKLTCPGVPDLYQGQEFWNDSLVDPDNRRPVDFSQRHEQLNTLRQRADEKGLLELSQGLLNYPSDPAFKLFVIWRALQVRKQHSDLFRSGDYVPVGVQGTLAEHFCAYQRSYETTSSIIVVPRDHVKLSNSVDGDLTRFAELEGLNETVAHIDSLTGRLYCDQFTGVRFAASTGRIPLLKLFQHFPLAFLISKQTSEKPQASENIS